MSTDKKKKKKKVTFDNRQGERGYMAIPFPVQDVMHEGHMVCIGQWDLAVTEVLLQGAME